MFSDLVSAIAFLVVADDYSTAADRVQGKGARPFRIVDAQLSLPTTNKQST